MAAMAASRYAASKLLLLQRTQPSPSVVSRWLVPRFTHTGSAPASSPAPGSQNGGTSNVIPPAPSPNADKQAKILMFQKELQTKKQEMYDLLSEVEDNRYYLPNPYNLGVLIDRIQNVKLLMNLSVDVTPKPFDERWEFYRQGRKVIVWSVYVASAVVTVWLTRLEKKDGDPKGGFGDTETENQGVIG